MSCYLPYDVILLRAFSFEKEREAWGLLLYEWGTYRIFESRRIRPICLNGPITEWPVSRCCWMRCVRSILETHPLHNCREEKTRYRRTMKWWWWWRHSRGYRMLGRSALLFSKLVASSSVTLRTYYILQKLARWNGIEMHSHPILRRDVKAFESERVIHRLTHTRESFVSLVLFRLFLTPPLGELDWFIRVATRSWIMNSFVVFFFSVSPISLTFFFVLFACFLLLGFCFDPEVSIICPHVIWLFREVWNSVNGAAWDRPNMFVFCLVSPSFFFSINNVVAFSSYREKGIHPRKVTRNLDACKFNLRFNWCFNSIREKALSYFQKWNAHHPILQEPLPLGLYF